MGGDQLDMAPQQADDGIARVGTAASELRSGWSSVHSSISGAEGQLGKGVLGAAFMGGYSAPSADIARQVDEGCTSMDVLYIGARPAPADYGQTSAVNAATLEAAGVPTAVL